jgi:hypothetical protein
MKRIFAAVLALVITLSGAVVAQAKSTKTIKIDRYVTLQVPTSITIPKGECADLEVKFTVRGGLTFPYHFVGLLVSKGAAYTLIAPGDPATDWTGKRDGDSGTELVKLCKYDWVDEEGENWNAVKNGRYTFSATLGQLKPEQYFFGDKRVTITVRG